jgi:hypothetical protein
VKRVSVSAFPRLNTFVHLVKSHGRNRGCSHCSAHIAFNTTWNAGGAPTRLKSPLTAEKLGTFTPIPASAIPVGSILSYSAGRSDVALTSNVFETERDVSLASAKRGSFSSLFITQG